MEDEEVKDKDNLSRTVYAAITLTALSFGTYVMMVMSIMATHGHDFNYLSGKERILIHYAFLAGILSNVIFIWGWWRYNPTDKVFAKYIIIFVAWFFWASTLPVF